MSAEKPEQLKFNHRIDVLIFILIGGLVALLPLVFSPRVAQTFYIPKISLFYAVGIALFPLFSIKVVVLRSKIPQNIINYAIIGYFIFALFSTIFSVHPLTSIIGMSGYGYGLIFLGFNILLFYSAMTSTSIQKYRPIFLYLILISSTIIVLIGFAQFFRWSSLFLTIGLRTDLRAAATFGNPVFFGGYLALVLPFLLYAFMSSNLPATGLSRRRWQLSPMERRPTVGRVSIPAATMERRPTEGAPRPWQKMGRPLLILVAIILISGLVVSLSRAAWLASIGGAIFFFLISYQSILKKGFNKKILIRLAVGVFLLILVTGLIISVQTGYNVVSRLTGIFKLGQSSSLARFEYWRLAFRVFVKHPLFGCGMGTYYLAVGKYIDLRYIKLIKVVGRGSDPHNFIFNTLATQGIFALIALLAIYAIYFYTGLKKRRELSEDDRLFTGALMASVLSILIFNSFNPENIAINPFTWMFMGISWRIFYPPADLKEINLKFISQTIAILFILSFLSLEIIPLRIFAADRSYLFAIIYKDDGLFKQAIKQNPLVPDYYHNFALKKFTEGLKAKNKGEINLSVKYYQKLLKLFPINPRAHQDLGDIYVNLGKFSEASKEYQIALEQNPYNPVALNNLGWCYQNLKDYQQAIKYYRKAIELDKNLDKSYLHLAEIYEKLGQGDKASYFRKRAEGR